MYKKLEAMGAGLLGMFVPKVDASAAVCYVRNYKQCWQCSYRPCEACCDSAGKNCQYVICK
ncbi:hypothetical protein ACNTMW_33065 [Planosporangium sp. 12N6]|jgi:hypothetical protein|uniref:hypothetical protein n=1 Tax=Planosporangium spinosum TaxID=3402278 RepID=UPI003CF61368